MKSSHRNILVATHRLPALFRLVLLVVCAATHGLIAKAQPVFASEPVVPAIPAALQSTDTPPSTTSPTADPAPLQWGTVTLRPRISYQFLHGDGILSRPGQQSTTTLQSFRPGLQLNLGTHWIFDYGATQTYYSNSDFEDTLAHLLSLNGGAGYGQWQVQFSQNYSSSSAPLVQTGRQTDQKSYDTALTVSYRFGTHMQLDTVLNQQVLLIDAPAPSTRNWYATERLNYRFSSRLNANVSVDYGYVSVTPGPDMTLIRPQAQLVWQPTDKVSLSLQGGSEKRKFRSGPADDLSTPSYSATITYAPFENTKITFITVREVAPSYVIGQLPKNTRWNIILDQRLFQYFHLHTGYAEEDSNYITTGSAATIARTDKGYLYNARLSATVFRRASITALYQHRTLNSNLPGFSFSGSYVGFEIGYRY